MHGPRFDVDGADKDDDVIRWHRQVSDPSQLGVGLNGCQGRLTILISVPRHANHAARCTVGDTEHDIPVAAVQYLRRRAGIPEELGMVVFCLQEQLQRARDLPP
jgi:hypothetical protein